jgi:hypothetical protein
MIRNSKSETLNPKSFGNLYFDIRYCLEFRILKLGFDK